MLLEHTPEQSALLASVAAMETKATSRRVLDGTRATYDQALDADLQAGGIFDAAAYPDFGPATAVQVVHDVCRSASVVEVAASSLIRPLLCPEAPRPLAVVVGGAARAVRFLPVARSVLCIRADGAGWHELRPGEVETVESFFAYPMGRLANPHGTRGRETAIDRDIAARLHLLGIAAETAGVLQGGLASVVEHVSARRQFGRPLGAFQAVQHRLAACAARIEGARWLALKAAVGTPGDAHLAAAYAQEMVGSICYDLHQFMGAMGLTLEHPLHRWTYRAKLLQSEFGGASLNYRDAARHAWG